MDRSATKDQNARAVDPTTVAHHKDDRRAAPRARRAIVILIALTAALLDWVLCAKIIGTDLVVDQGFGPQVVHPVLVAAAPIISGLAAWLLLAVLEHFLGRRAATVWRVIAGVVLIGSLWSPITMALSVPAAIALVSMHVVVGTTFIVGLPGRRVGG
ncbi:DUF6069 family protein [Microlunatus sp. Gsoil 973]|jgi:hypothetical protein|uniref:DUF6069 family protein n=1 Tax=Microlunatus sp. Gsoil 973 TaxID=2672569 RepID=UPI0012B47695|nr:DUF6069 family protein [Microlunatus sp. Gsoil 973]QGN31599.1 hypothetical protein GJV80_00745 [Microlunatus sp. Gsoil 973]